MRITFVNQKPVAYIKYTSPSNLEPLGLEYIAAIAEKEGHNINLLQQVDEPEDIFLKKIFDTQPDVVAFTTMTYSYPSAIKIAKKIKDKNKNIITVFGGIHVTSVPASIKEECIDFIILGEGEYSFRDLINTIEFDGDLSKVKGIAYKNEGGGIKINEYRERIENLDELPFPYRLSEILAKTNINTIMNPPLSKQKGVAQILYSRGCPYGCSFCASRNIWGDKIKWRSAKNVVEEIKELQKRFGTNAIFFADLTFNANPGKVYELCNEIKNQKVDIKWYALLRIATPSGRSLISEELLTLMKNTGCSKVGYGLESLTIDEKSYKKFIDLNTLKQVLEYGNNLGLIQRGYLIIGHPSETKESLELTKKRLMELPLDDLRVSFLAPFPDTSIYHEYKLKGIITTDDWERYTGNEPILKLDNINKKELEQIRAEIFSSFFNNSNYKKRIESKIKKFPNLKDGFYEFLTCLKQGDL